MGIELCRNVCLCNSMQQCKILKYSLIFSSFCLNARKHFFLDKHVIYLSYQGCLKYHGTIFVMLTLTSSNFVFLSHFMLLGFVKWFLSMFPMCELAIL